MYSVMTEPHARARHATEYQRLKVWFARRLHELGLMRLLHMIHWIRFTPITKPSIH